MSSGVPRLSLRRYNSRGRRRQTTVEGHVGRVTSFAGSTRMMRRIPQPLYDSKR
jgi:hypothetical protein